MATSNLIIYEPLDSFVEQKDYWESYIEFYELYWGGPPSPFGVWFANEYDNFKKSFSQRIEIDPSEVKDCFFIKDEDGKFYIAPSESETKNNLIYIENIIPVEWFLLFIEDERKSLFSHWGFNAIYYSTKLRSGIERVKTAKDLYEQTISRVPDDIKESEIISILTNLIRGCDQLLGLLSGYDSSGHIILNYGDICTFIHAYTLDNEKSVADLSAFNELISNSEYEKAATSIKILFQKWNEIYENASGQSSGKPIQ
ncbi:MAG: hypothetical protein GWN11_05265 [Candidatus Dadabacteria bacterium]|nr:hypothetical protein [Candidatus Dadabacteria bacterium]